MPPTKSRDLHNDPESPDQKIHPEYAKLLLAAAKRQGLNGVAWAELAGLSPATVSRLKKGQGAVKSTRALRAVLVKLGEKLPPIVFDADGVYDDKTSSWADEWVELGTELRSSSPREYERTVQSIKRYLEARRLVDGGIQLIADPLPRNPDPDDK